MSRPTTLAFHFVNAEEALKKAETANDYEAAGYWLGRANTHALLANAAEASGCVPAERERRAKKRQELQAGEGNRA